MSTGMGKAIRIGSGKSGLIMMHFDFISKHPREDNSGMYTVISDEPGCKLAIIDLDRFPEKAGEENDALIYNEQDGTGSRYHYKVTLLDSIEPMDPRRKNPCHRIMLGLVAELLPALIWKVGDYHLTLRLNDPHELYLA